MRILRLIVLLLAFFFVAFPTVFAQKNYNTYARRNRPSSAPWTFAVNGGVYFPEVYGVGHKIYGSKDYNPAFGISIGKQVISNIGIRTDLATGKLSGNNFGTPPALTDQTPSFYRNFTTDVKLSASANIVLSFPLFRTGAYKSRPFTVQGWGGAGVINFESQFVQNPSTTIYYGTVTDVYTCFGGALKYRVGKRVDLGANYVVHMYNGYNLDAVQVKGPNKDRFSFAYISLNLLLGEMEDWRYGRSKSCYTF
jgi:hypothetical protein